MWTLIRPSLQGPDRRPDPRFDGASRLGLDEHVWHHVKFTRSGPKDWLGSQAVDEVRRRVEQDIHGHRGLNHDPLYGIRNHPWAATRTTSATRRRVELKGAMTAEAS